MADAVYGRGFLELVPQVSPAALGNFAGGFQSNLLAKLGPVGVAAGGALAVGIGGALAAGIATFNLGESFNDAFKTIRIGTGATGGDLEGLKGDFKATFSSVPTDMGSAATAVADLNTRLGLTGGELQDRSGQFLELSRITGTDLAGNIETATRVFGDWGVEVGAQEGALDAMFRASQATGVSVDGLGQQLVRYGAPLRQLGFGFEESAALIGKFEKEGVNGELVLGSMRIALGKMAREGEPAQETFRRVTEEIKNAGSASEANGLALELFGARAGPDMAAAIREGRFEVGDLFEAVSGGTDTIRGVADETSTWRESLQVLGNKVLVKLEPLATGLFNGIGSAIEAVTPFLESAIAWFEKELPPVIEDLKPIIKGIIDTVKILWDLFGPVVLATIKGTWEAIKAVIQTASAVFRGVSTAVRTMVDTVKGLWDGLVGFFGNLPGRISSAVSGMWDGIRDAFRGAVNWIITKWNNFSLKIGGQRVDLPFGLGFDIPSITLDTPNIPLFDAGGVVDGRPGRHVLGILQAGERVLTAAENELYETGRSGPVNNFYGVTDPHQLARLVSREQAWAALTAGA